MQLYKTKRFAKFVRQERITDASLREAILRANLGIIDADLGGGLIKQRVARQGQGRSGGYRMIVAYRAGDRAFFLFGFAKNKTENIDPDELIYLRLLAEDLLAADPAIIRKALDDDFLQEIPYGQKERD